MWKFEKGVVVLPIILLIGGVITEIGIGGAFVALYFEQTVFGIKTSTEAIGAAHSGVADAMMQIARNKDFSQATTTVQFGPSSAEVSVLNGFDAGGNPVAGKSTITAIGSAGMGILTKRRKLQSVVNINQVTGEMRAEWLREIPL